MTNHSNKDKADFLGQIRFQSQMIHGQDMPGFTITASNFIRARSLPIGIDAQNINFQGNQYQVWTKEDKNGPRFLGTKKG